MVKISPVVSRKLQYLKDNNPDKFLEIVKESGILELLKQRNPRPMSNYDKKFDLAYLFLTGSDLSYSKEYYVYKYFKMYPPDEQLLKNLYDYLCTPALASYLIHFKPELANRVIAEVKGEEPYDCYPLNYSAFLKLYQVVPPDCIEFSNEMDEIDDQIEEIKDERFSDKIRDISYFLSTLFEDAGELSCCIIDSAEKEINKRILNEN